MITRHPPALATLLDEMRNHPGFPELLKAVEAPAIPRFKRSQAAEAEKARAEWIYSSGRRDQHDAWIVLLTGQGIPPNAE